MMFSGEPVLVPHDDGVRWTVQHEFVIHDDMLGRLVIPAGFVTDLGSIPKIFQNVISPEGRPLRAFLGHDWFYAKQFYSRAIADDFLLRGMVALKVGWLERWIIYLGVRLGGGFAWRSDAKERRR